MNESLLEHLRALESVARVLAPGAEQRAALTRDAVAHAQAHLEWHETAPSMAPDLGSAEAVALAPIGRDPIGWKRALELLSTHVDKVGQNPTGAGFFAYIPVGNLYHAALGDYLAAVTNRFSGSSFAAPGAVRIENQVIQWLASLVGYPATCAGNLTSGGSLANFSAIVTAREAAGLHARDYGRAVVYLTDQTHHCITRGLKVAGLGECVPRRVPMDARYRMEPRALDRAIEADLQGGRIPWLIVANAGTTDTGSVDPLDSIADIARDRKIWMHVDGSYGGLFAMCAEGRKVLKGIERSDSVAMDPHKGLALPFGLGVVLVKDAEAMRSAYAFEATYISRDVHASEDPSPMDYSTELSRPFRALRLWLPLQALGTEPFEAALEEKLLLARYAHARLSGMEGIEVGPEPELSVLFFRALPANGDPDEFQFRLERAIQDDGRINLSSSTVDGKRVMRFAVLSPHTHLADVDAAMAVLEELIRALWKTEG